MTWSHDIGLDPSRLTIRVFDRMQRDAVAWKTLLETFDR